MKFVVLAPGTHALSWDLATPGNCEYTDAAADVIPGTSWNNGNVTLGSGCCSVFASITPSGSTSICQGSSVTLNATSGTGLSYQWFLNGSAISGATNSSLVANSAGSYTVRVSESANCFYTSAAVSLTVNALPAATITAGGATTFCQGASVTLNANTGSGLSYQWLLNNAAIAGATNASLVATAQGSYTVTVTNLNGCSATSSSTSVTVRSLPIATITGATSFCQGANTVLSANTGTGRTYQWRRNNVNIIGATSANYTVVTAGTYTVAVTSNSCVAVSNAIAVSVNPLPTVTVDAAGSTSLCQGNSVTLNATTDPSNTIQWRRNGTDIAGATNNTLTASDAGAYTARVTSSTGCAATSNAVQVTVRPNSASTVSASICQGQTYTFGSQSLTSAGTYNRTVTSANGCDSVSTLILNVTRPPPPSGLACYQTATYNSTTCSYDISGTAPPAPTNLPCYQSANFDSVTCTWIISGAPNPIIVTTVSVCDTNYYWSVSNQSYNSSGTYFHTSNCQDYELRLVLNTPAIITTQPVSQIANQYNSISFMVSSFTASGLTNNNRYQWQRSINNGPYINISNSALFSGSNTSTLLVNTATTSLHSNKFRCIVTANCGSPAISSEATLNVIPGNPIALSIGNTNICPNTSNTPITIPVISNSFTNVAAMTFNLVPSPGLSYIRISNIHPLLSGLSSNLVNGKIRVSWFNQSNINLPSNAVLFNIVMTANGPGTINWDTSYNFFFDEYNGYRISVNSNGSVTTSQPIIPTITTLSGICENGPPVSFSANPAGGTFSGTGIVNGLFYPSISGPGYHNINYTYTSPEGCTFSTTVTQYVSALPSGSAGQDVSICPGGSAALTATGGDSYLWSNGATSSVNSVSPSITTTYTVTIFNSAGCFTIDSVTVTVSSGSSIQIASGDSASLCLGNSVNLTTTGASQVFWYPSNGLSSTTSLSPVANPTSTTTYYVIGINNEGCVSSDSIVVVVNPNPAVSFSIPTNACVNGASIPLTGLPTGGSFSGTGVSSGSNCNGCTHQFTPSVAGLGNHIITYEYTDPITGCSSSYNQTIEILNSPIADAGTDQTICEGQTTILTASGGVAYLWNNGLTTPSITVS
ncbi:MAG: beta strand repeat-containing protein, partial [Bacteroidota bacterium]